LFFKLRYTKNELENVNQIQNYVCLLRNISNFEKTKKYAIVAELCSSRHDTFQLSKFFLTLRNAYTKLYNTPSLYFRLISIDYCWASIHAILEILNQEKVIDYANRVYALSKGEIPLTHDKSWLCSCTSHTMNRFIRSIKKNIANDNDDKRFFGFAMSLMLNCQNLDSIKNCFRKICYICLSETQNDLCISSKHELESAIENRPVSKTIDSLIDESFKLAPNSEDDGSNSKSSNTNAKQSNTSKRIETESDQNFNNEKKRQIKESSPFTKEFLKIEEEVRFELEQIGNHHDSNFNTNKLYYPAFIKQLQEKFMPYCFIWASFTFKGLNLDHATNGIIEKEWGTEKSQEPDVLPHKHIFEKFKYIKGIKF
jgi:hypothetical protein